jgi:hypothetical protein
MALFLPASGKNMAWLRPIKRLLYPITSRYFCTAIHARGVLRGTGQPFECLLVDNTVFAQYLLPKMFEGAFAVKRKWKLWIPGLRRIVRAPWQGVDLCVAMLPARYDADFDGLQVAKTREWVLQLIDTSAPWEEITGRFHDNKRWEVSRRMASPHGFDHRISHDPKDLERFYHRMYLPHIRKFSDSARLHTRERMHAALPAGFLVFIMEGEQEVAGGLCTLEDGKLVYRWSGVLEGDERHIRSGAQMAVYYVLLTIAKERDCLALDLQKSRPFLSDGVYRAKRGWGASVHADAESEETWVYFFNVSRSPLVTRFFEDNPAVVHTARGLRGLIGQTALDDPVPPAVVKELNRRFRSPGLDGLTVMTREGRLVEI